MNKPFPACAVDARRAALFAQREHFNGIDFVELGADQHSLCVHFFGPVPALFDEAHPDGLRVDHLRIEGGERIVGIAILAIRIDQADKEHADDCLHVTLDRAGDFSQYALCLTHAGLNLDPRYACATFSFKADCPRLLDCKTEPVCMREPEAAPEISYLAKDYASFRQLMLDRLALTMPDWHERHVPDLGITLIEVLAYAADHLSYYQDAVATEAYLETARQRISVRRHARLVDYRMHEGLNARAWVSIATSADTPALRADELYFITGFQGLTTNNGNLVDPAELNGVPWSRYEVFEPVSDAPDAMLRFYAAHSEMVFYTWGGNQCCLAQGATCATLLDEQREIRLRVGDVVVFEEVIGPRTGKPADADPARRHVVRLSCVEPLEDALFGARKLLNIGWAPADALPFSLCLSARLDAPDCRHIEQISVARGNVVLVDHGRTVQEPGPFVVTATTVSGDCACEGSVPEMHVLSDPLHIVLEHAPLTFADPLPLHAPAQHARQRAAHLGRPQVRLSGSPAPDERWTAQPDLLGSGPTDQHFVAEIDDEGRAHLRFGDGKQGLAPPPGMAFGAQYRVGNGLAGNVARGAIGFMVLREQRWNGITVIASNPLAAFGAMAPETSAEVRLKAPHAFRAKLVRAITADDYASIASRFPGIGRSAAQLRWTGSWYEARVGIDPLGTTSSDPALLQAVEAMLAPFRRIGHDLDVVQASYVALDIALRVCVSPQFDSGAVRAALLDVLGNRVRVDGSLGMFHPDRLGFGDDIHLSGLIAAAHAVDGVDSVEVVRFQRLHTKANGEIESGVLPIGEMHIARLDNDANFPEHGVLEILTGGGR